MSKSILKRAIISMGYRKAKEDTYLKPIAFGMLKISFVEVEDVEKCEMVLYIPGRENLLRWDTMYIDFKNNGTIEDRYNEYCNTISYNESYIGIEHLHAARYDSNSLAFTTPYDIYQSDEFKTL